MSDTWTIGELAERAAEALRPAAGNGQGSSVPSPNGRVRDVPNERLIRWYTTIGLLDPPLARRGRVALYGRRHLAQLVAIKRRQAAGRSIAEIQAELAGATDATLEAIARLPSPAGFPAPSGPAESPTPSGPAGSPAPSAPAIPPAAPNMPAVPGARTPPRPGRSGVPARFWARDAAGDRLAPPDAEPEHVPGTTPPSPPAVPHPPSPLPATPPTLPEPAPPLPEPAPPIAEPAPPFTATEPAPPVIAESAASQAVTGPGSPGSAIAEHPTPPQVTGPATTTPEAPGSVVPQAPGATGTPRSAAIQPAASRPGTTRPGGARPGAPRTPTAARPSAPNGETHPSRESGRHPGLVEGVRLGPAATLLLGAAARPLRPDDVAAIVAAAQPLLAVLYERGLAEPGAEGSPP